MIRGTYCMSALSALYFRVCVRRLTGGLDHADGLVDG